MRSVRPSPASSLQTAEPAVCERALAEEQQHQEAERRRLRKLLAVVQRAQQLLVQGAGGTGGSARHLQPWWPTSQVGARAVRAAGAPAPRAE